jgi:iron complex outermembrane receptor protein
MAKRTPHRTRVFFCLATISAIAASNLLCPATSPAVEPWPAPVDSLQVPRNDFESLRVTYQPPANQPGAQEPPDELRELEQLLQQPAVVPALSQEVTTVSRQESTVGKSPAAVFVITNDMIRRSGATEIPEVLRMVPGLDVARISANKWAVGIRGLTARFNRNLLVQIDGRNVYTSFFGGTYWDTQDVFLQDVERIEVIRGPGATVWGENAVNGIINIITKGAKETQGGLAYAVGGSQERGTGGVRYGGQIGDHTQYRVWGKGFERGPGFDPGPNPNPPIFDPTGIPNDAWRQLRGGFRIDSDPTECDHFTLQGDVYDGHSAGGVTNLFPSPVAPFRTFLTDAEDVFGGDVLARWTHTVDDDSAWSFQCYYDRVQRNAQIFDFTIDTFDLDFQYNFPLGDYHRLIVGAGYRLYSDNYEPGINFGVPRFDMTPRQLVYDVPSAFIQDEITLVDDRLFFTAGTKLSRNVFSGFQVQPTGRLLWTPTERQSAWAAVSRAVRTPARTSAGLLFVSAPAVAPPFPATIGSPNFDSEQLIAYELGYRAAPTDAFSWDLALFYNTYEGLQATRPDGITPGPPAILNNLTVNGLDGETYGVELAANYQVSESWKLYGAYTFLQIQLHRNDPRISAGQETGPEGQSPQNQFYLWSSWDLGCDWEFDLIGRYVDQLEGFGAKPNVGRYIEMDTRLAYRPNCCWEFAVVGRNLLDSHHREFQDSLTPGTEVVRSVYGMVTRTW